MRSYPTLSFLFAFTLPPLASAYVAGCSAPADEPTGSSEAALVREPKLLVRQVATLLKGPDGACKNCHTVDRDEVRDWGQAMQAVHAACVASPGLTPRQRVDCLRVDPSSGESPFSAAKLGFYAAGATQAEFVNLFAQAYGPAEGAVRHAAFVQRVSMPIGGAPLTPAQFKKVKGWVLLGMPALNDSVFDDDVTPVPGCEESTTPALADHIGRMKTEGWGARLAELATPMFGCGAATNPLACLTTQPDLTAALGEPAVVQKLRELHKQPLASHFWTRSSADGRYLGFGFGFQSGVVDLKKPNPIITVEASYDPYFFPSNDGFGFAGALSDGALRFCRQSLLADVAAQPSPAITLGEAKCMSLGGAVYQSVGSALDGVRYFVTVGTHVDDDGGHSTTSPLPAPFDQDAATVFVPMENDGQSYEAGPAATVGLPREGDAMLSPSSLLVGTRYAGTGSQQGGYRVRFVDAKPSGGGGLSVQTPLAAQLCFRGGKLNFSFDERFLATHQYVDPSDPAHASLPRGSSNIVIADLKTGKKTRLTKMGAGQYALFPHFRADGWLYFLVRDMGKGTEFVVATDAALRVPG